MRTTIGLTGLAFAAFGAFVWWSSGEAVAGGFLLRVGAVLGALWFGYPAFERINRRTIWIVAPAAAVVFARPRSILIVLPVLVWFLRSRTAAERSDR